MSMYTIKNNLKKKNRETHDTKNWYTYAHVSTGQYFNFARGGEGGREALPVYIEECSKQRFTTKALTFTLNGSQILKLSFANL